MSVWFDDLARRLGSVEEVRLDRGRLSRRSTLGKMLGAAIAASSMIVTDLLPRSAKGAADKCKKNKDCRPNQRCRDGRCERDDNGGGGGGNDK